MCTIVLFLILQVVDINLPQNNNKTVGTKKAYKLHPELTKLPTLPETEVASEDLIT